MLWKDTLFRREQDGLRVVRPHGQRAELMVTFHEDIGHWHVISTKKLAIDRFWWLGVYSDMTDYVSSCDCCQHSERLPTYRMSLRAPFNALFENFCIDFAGQFKQSKAGKMFVLIAVEHLTGWPVASATGDSTAVIDIKLIQQEIIIFFGPL